ncbi:MAG TPA: hypothetical protein VF059_04320 [Casimicrobiaceae bacterium]
MHEHSGIAAVTGYDAAILRQAIIATTMQERTTEATAPPWGETIGWVDEPREDAIAGPLVRVAGWALATRRIRAVELRLEGHVLRARYGQPRHDVAAVRPGYPDNPDSGFEFVGDVSQFPAAPGADRRTVAIVAIAGDGSERLLGRRSLVDEAAHARWRFLSGRPARPFHLIPALSGVTGGSATGLATWYSAYVSATTRIAMRVPILYLRTTTGRADDYRFDPAFDVGRRLGARAVADDALAHVLEHARRERLPVLITLNGGIWADAGGTCPDWDVNDRLEEDVANCQWNERDAVMPDDYLKHLPGSQESPELARALTLNVYAHAVRAYKKRNLQQAARHLVSFMAAHPDLFVGINLDPDVYINPFFAEAQWYDYNPGTLAQFRHWLAGTGPYAGECGNDVPDLSRCRRATPRSLADVCAIARRRFRRWEDVDPPRVFRRGGGNAYWHDPWVQEWEMFRRHLVALHHDELAQWLVAAGIPPDRIWTSQGLMAPADDAMPLALSIASPVKNHDSAGVSIEGSKPRDGHLGAIVYGASATNEIPMENGRSLYATLAALDPGFGLVEFNTADLRHPQRQPGYAEAYRALRDLWNAGARFVSPMAWNGSNGLHAQSPEYVSYTAWRNTPLEAAALDFLLARAGLPLGSKLWTFGSRVHADDDGWAVAGGSARPLPGALEITAERGGRVALVSPPEIALAGDAIDGIVVGLPDAVAVDAIEVAGRETVDASWRPLARRDGGEIEVTAAGRLVRVAPAAGPTPIDQLRLTVVLARAAPFTLARVAILRR